MRLHEAVRDNAEWCDAFCRAHGVSGTFGPSGWTSSERTPPFYPDAVTLDPAATADGLLSLIDTGPGCSIKDSFASLDLVSAGFEILFEAQRITREPVDAVRDNAECWLPQPSDFTFPGLILGPAEGGSSVIATISGAVVGLSNLCTDGDLDKAWADACAAVSAHFPGRPIVGYEHGEDLEVAQRQGFTPLGPLRIWLKSQPRRWSCLPGT